jgi:nucleoside-diphosphate-sugar epimerase
VPDDPFENSLTVRGRAVLVTGATGFIGSAVCRELTALGAEVHGLSRRGAAPDAVARSWACDASDYDALRRVIRDVRPTLVYHLASYVSGTRALDAVLPTFRANLASTVNLLTVAAELGSCRLVLAGSLEEPGVEAEPVPASPYAAAKWACGGYARMFHALYQLPVVTARIFMAYGPGQANLRMLVPYVILSLLRREAPELSSGRRPVDWIYVDDVVRGLLALGAAEAIDDGSVEFGSGSLVTIREIVERIVDLVGSDLMPRFGAIPDRAHERIRCADVEATRRRLGWAPSVSLDEGLRRTIEHYREHLAATCDRA